MTQVQSPLKPFGKRLSTDFCDHEHQPLSSHMIQKRRRYQDENLSPEPENVIEDNEDIFRQKRCRQPDGGSFNVPRYTQQQMDEYEQSKNQEVERMREEMQEYINQKDQVSGNSLLSKKIPFDFMISHAFLFPSLFLFCFVVYVFKHTKGSSSSQ
mmetsp:Transcript_16123/g.20868  ORF Transcript_16123/g.20868 Transcript_16123/m.20868 type:complete len:155 (-) Transcript_16123:547-1011(-)